MGADRRGRRLVASVATLVLGVALLFPPRLALALCAVEGALEAVRLNLEEAQALVVHIRQPRVAVPNAFHMDRPAAGGLGDIPGVLQLLALANPATTTVLAVGDLAVCPDVPEIEVAHREGKAVHSGRLVRMFVKYR